MIYFKRKVYNELLNWKKDFSGKYAALLEGPRRVGKSTIAEQFATNEYKSNIIINCTDLTPAMDECIKLVNNRDLFFLTLQTITGVELFERESVIIIDEIQRRPQLREAIKYLVKDGRYDYIETGSLLSIKKNVQNIVIPSEEHSINVYPMDYEEFLWALGDTYSFKAASEIYNKKMSLGNSIGREKIRNFRIYMAVGGMPQAVEAYIEGKNFFYIDSVKKKILKLYEEDFNRIDPSGTVSKLFKSIPYQLSEGSRKYSIRKALKAKKTERRENKLSELVNSKTVIPCYKVTAPSVFLSQDEDVDYFKLYLADTGLMVSLLFDLNEEKEENIYAKLLSDKLPANLGFLYENAVATAIASSGRNLFFMTWPKENSTHNYEIDFLIRRKTHVQPIECKSSRIDSHLSLDEFCRKYSSIVESPLIVSQKELKKMGAITNIPFYMLPSILDS